MNELEKRKKECERKNIPTNLNPRCPELRDAVNPNQVHSHCPFIVTYVDVTTKYFLCCIVFFILFSFI